MKKRVNITIEKKIQEEATRFASENYECGTFSHMVALALLAMMKKASRKAAKR